VPELGEEIVYKPQDSNDEYKFIAIVDRNAESPPAYGYEKILSQKHHVFTFLRDEIPAPQRGDHVVVQGISYAVDFVYADDDVVWRVAGR